MKYLLFLICFVSYSTVSFTQVQSTLPSLPTSILENNLNENDQSLIPEISLKLRSDPNFKARPGQVYYDKAKDEYWFMLNREWHKALTKDSSGEPEPTIESKPPKAHDFSSTTTENVGIGNPNPSYPLDVSGSVRFDGDFINQEILGSHSDVVQQIPITNLVPVPLTNTNVSVTINNNIESMNSSVLLTGFTRVFGGNLNGSSSSLGQYFIALQKDTDPNFSNATILTYTTGICYIETPNDFTSASIGFGGGGHVSFVDSGLAPGTHYYRLVFFANGLGINAGTYDIYQRDLNLLQIKN